MAQGTRMQKRIALFRGRFFALTFLLLNNTFDGYVVGIAHTQIYFTYYVD